MRRTFMTAPFAALILMLGTTKSFAQTQGYAGSPRLYKPGNAGVMGIGPGGREAYQPQYYSPAPSYGYGGYGGYGSAYYLPNVTGMPSVPESTPDETYLQRPSPRIAVPPTPKNPNSAAIDVRVPPDSQLSFQGRQTQQNGTVRFFESPPLAPGKTYAYKVKALWTDTSGQKIERTRTVQIHAGDYVRLDLREE